jgi:hypothetical protein
MLLQLGIRNARAAKLSLKNSGKWQFGEHKALVGGGYAGQKLRSVVNIYQPKRHHHHHLVIYRMLSRNYLIVVDC